MATKTLVKTGVDFTARIDLKAGGEVTTSLTQIFIQFYYELGKRKNDFSFFALDLADQKIIDRAAELGVTVRQITFDSEIILCAIPKVDTDTLKIEECLEVNVFAEISYIDSNGDVQKFSELDEEGNECDKFIVILEKSVTEGWL